MEDRIMKTNKATAKKSEAKVRKPKVIKKAKVVAIALPANVTRSYTLGLVIEEDVLAGKTSVGREDLVARADGIYAKAHGKSANATEAKWSSNQGIGAMAGLQLIETSKDTVFFKPELIALIKSRSKVKK
jgi:hypothetical protein